MMLASSKKTDKLDAHGMNRLQRTRIKNRIHASLNKYGVHIEGTSDGSRAIELLRTIPGIGAILSIVIAHEIGDIARFPSSSHLAAYAGTTPRVHA